MRFLRSKRVLSLAATSLMVVSACGDKKDSDSPSAQAETESEDPKGSGKSGAKTAENAPTSIAQPVGVLSLAIDSMASIMSIAGPKMLGNGAALTDDENAGFTEDDCNEHAEPKARAGDGEEHTDNQGRLRLSHPRAALQSLYCQMQKDTGSADSLLGALSSNKMLFCFLGSGLKFDGVAQDLTITEALVDGCGVSTDDKKEMFGEPFADIKATATASRPAAFGDENSWDGSIALSVGIGSQDAGIKILMRDSDDVLAVASFGGGQPADAYVVAINKATGEIRYEAKFQRLDVTDGSNSTGWNRHARAYVKGSFDSAFKFSDVTDVHGAYSDISIEAGGKKADSLQRGTLWTATGKIADGIKSYAYDLDCPYSGSSYICKNANLAASWKETAGSSACEGTLTGKTCASNGLPIGSDADTAFVMNLDHSDYQKVSAWFESLAVPTFTSIELKISQ